MITSSKVYVNYMRTIIETIKAPSPGSAPYSQAIVMGNMIFTAGQIPLLPEGTLLEGTIEEKTHQVMKNLQAVLTAADASFADVVKTTIYVTDMADYGKVNEVYASYLSPPYPARETICVKALPLGATVEISLVAMKESS